MKPTRVVGLKIKILQERIRELEAIVEKKDSLVKFLIKRFTEITKPTRAEELQAAFADDDYETVMEIAVEAAKQGAGT